MNGLKKVVKVILFVNSYRSKIFQLNDNISELQEEIESIKSFSAKSVERAESLNQEKVSKALNTPYMNYYSISLLRRLSEQSLSDKPIENLADPSLIGPVTKYVKLTRDKRVSQALMRILQ